jgi:hypothetical protein
MTKKLYIVWEKLFAEKTKFCRVDEVALPSLKEFLEDSPLTYLKELETYANETFKTDNHSTCKAMVELIKTQFNTSIKVEETCK